MTYKLKNEKFAQYLLNLEKTGEKGLYYNPPNEPFHIVAVPYIGINADCGIYTNEHYMDLLMLKATNECYRNDLDQLVNKVNNNANFDLLNHEEVLCKARISVSAEERNIEENYIDTFLSIYTGRHHKRKGYGTYMMLFLKNHFIKYHDLIDNIYSMVKTDNLESYNFHKSIGAKEIHIENKNNQYPTLWETGFSSREKAHDFFVFSYK